MLVPGTGKDSYIGASGGTVNRFMKPVGDPLYFFTFCAKSEKVKGPLSAHLLRMIQWFIRSSCHVVLAWGSLFLFNSTQECRVGPTPNLWIAIPCLVRTQNIHIGLKYAEEFGL